ncbi:PAS domain-containing hybrid sensor histidine kinase/response regulator [Lutibacter sp.]|uniref:hybrid sensor histidine kinase/response regulator n=1 Tax=Lutibacter sp. TaxID=1925666 RepID=UPI0025C225E7|nr:PAS domain-containing hybrid sensor histidine kinase/response regulator [Lutibacter sp.]MCF6169006.1 PAS domain S-box protein [Lutibacter sp.]
MQYKLLDITLQFIEKNRDTSSSNDFFKNVSTFLASLFQIDTVLIGKYNSKTPNNIEIISHFSDNKFLPISICEIENSPFQDCINNNNCIYSEKILQVFPQNKLLKKLKAESFIGVTLWGIQGKPIGLISLIDTKPMVEAKRINDILKIIAIKASKVLEQNLYNTILSSKTKDLNLVKVKIEESESKFKKLSNLTFEGILIHNNGVAIDVNLSFLKMFGFKREEVLGNDITKLIYPKKFHNNIYKNRANKYTLPYEIEGIKKDGSVFPIEVEARNIISEDNKPIRVTAFRDISNRKKAEAENKKLLNAIEQSANTIIITDLKGNIEYTNPKFTELTGFQPEEVIGKDSIVLNLKPQNKKDFKDLLNTIKSGNIWKGQFDSFTKDGLLYWVQITITPLKNCEGEIINYLAILEDITEKKNDEKKLKEAYQIIQKNEEYLKNKNKELKLITNELSKKNNLVVESKNRFHKLFEQSPVSLWEEDFSKIKLLLNKKKKEIKNLKEYLNHNPDFVTQCLSNLKVLNVNDFTLRLLGIKKKDELINNFNKNFNNKTIETFKNTLLAIASDKKEFTSETEFVKGNGEIIKAIIKLNVIEKSSIAIVSIINISEIKKIQYELTKAKEKAEESDRLKTEFLNNMSHEIRTPMNGILGFSQLLNNPDLDFKKRNNFINIIQNSGTQLLHIIDDIIEISRLGTKQVKVNEEKVCLNDVILELFSIFDIKAKENKTPIYLKKALSDKQSTIFTDKTKLNKILSNLLENALKFTNKGFIEFGYYLENNNDIVIYIKDTGIGIKKEKQHLIFERFTQAEKKLTKKVGGLGLGLSIAKENTELLGGKISVKSNINAGATFFIKIPHKPVYNNVKTKNKYTILIAEDEEVNYLYLETLLKDILKLNCNTIHVKNGKEAVNICKKKLNIDVVLMDIKMPIMDGIEATKSIKKQHPNIPIIAQTAYTTTEEKNKAFLAGCDEFISKPINKEKLKEIILKIIKK